MLNAIQNFPPQKLPYNKKTKEWRKKHLDWADSQSRLFSETIRKRVDQKKINVDLYNGKLNKEDMKLTLNPGGLDEFYVPDAIQHYPIIAPRIDVLVGEEASRRFDWHVTITNPTSITMAENNKKKELQGRMQSLMEADIPEEEMEAELKKLSDYMAFEWQDFREKRANELLKHFIKELGVKHKFSEGFKDALINAEEGYLCDIIHGNPIFEKLNPLKTYVIQHGYSNRYEDASVIVIDDYWSPGRAVDTYHADLKEKDIDYILNNGKTNPQGGRELDGDRFKEDIDDREGILLARNNISTLTDNLDMIQDAFQGFTYRNTYFDTNGNIRVLRVFWRSYKKIQMIKWYDEDGEEQVKYRNEDYVPNTALGEESETRWVSQWWQGVKIGKNVYVDMRPRPIQYNKIGNPGYNTPGIVGQIYNTNDQRAVSMLDRAKVFNYIFNGAFLRLMDAYSKYFGPILEIDKAKMPVGWDITKTLYFAKKAGVLVIDSFREGNKGNATGKLAGAIGNTTGKIMQSDISSFVQQNLNLMEYAKSMMDEITGVPKQRLGNVEKRETVGGVDTAIRQSNYVTEMIFRTHDELKKRALILLLETAKIAMKGNKMKLQYIGSDYTNQVMEIDGDQFAEEEYGLDISDGSDSMKLEQNLDQLAHAALQNQMLSFSTIMKIYNSPSLTEIQRLIEKEEREKEQQAAEQEQQQLQSQERIAQAQMQQKEQEQALKKYEIDERSRIEELKIMAQSQDKALDRDSASNSLDYDKMDLDYTKHLEKLEQDMIKIDNEMKRHKDKMGIEKEKIAAAKAKPKTTSA